ncbi:MAG: hypothetical protein GY835_13975 [bacterium]|nr:hypothetical protein [bacterium]
MANLDQINGLLQSVLAIKKQDSVRAVEAASWLSVVGILKDSSSRPGLPLRNLLRAGKVSGARQATNGRWFIDRT